MTSERLAQVLGYAAPQVRESLDRFIDGGLLARSPNPGHAARLFELVIDGPAETALRRVLTLAVDRKGRGSLLDALSANRPPPQRKVLGARPRLRIVQKP